MCFICFSRKTSDSLCNRKLSKAGVSLLKPEPRLRGAADSVLHSIRTLPCHILRYLQFMEHCPKMKALHRYGKQTYCDRFSNLYIFINLFLFWDSYFQENSKHLSQKYIINVLLSYFTLTSQLSHRPLVWKEDAVPRFCRFTAESHEAHATTRPG